MTPRGDRAAAAACFALVWLCAALLDVWWWMLSSGALQKPLPWPAFRQVALLYALLAVPLGASALLLRRIWPASRRADAPAFAAAFALCAAAFVQLGSAINFALPVRFSSPLALAVDAALASAIALVFVRLLRVLQPVPVARRFVLLGAASLLLASPLLVSAWQRSDRTPPRAAAAVPNLVFILIDTLRADHLSCYGYAANTSPNIDAVAAEGVRFQEAHVQAPWTRASVTSIFTSLYPSQHGNIRLDDRLDDSATTLAEHLKAHGFSTRAFVTNRNVSPAFGLDQGFDAFYFAEGDRGIAWSWIGRVFEQALPDLLHALEDRDLLSASRAHDLDARVLGELRAHVSNGLSQPTFLYLHLLAPHSPYEEWDRHRRDVGDAPIALQSPEPARTAFEVAESLPADALRRVIAAYDAEIRWADRIVGEILQELETAGVLENALTVITSDHGEEFYDHGNWRHGRSLYREMLRVPLILRLPGRIRAGRVIDTPVSSIDLFPTLAALLGLPGPEVAYGRDLSAALRDGSVPARHPIYSEHLDSPYEIRSLIAEGVKFIHTTDGGRELEQVFSVTADPAEQHDRRSTDGDRAAALRSMLHDLRDQLVDVRLRGGKTELDAETLESLRALGYVP